MFGSTLTLTIDSVDKVLNLVNQDNYGSEYRLREAAQVLTFKIRHAQESGDYVRHNVFFSQSIHATATEEAEVYTASATFRSPESGDPTTASNLMLSVAGFLTSGNVGILSQDGS